MDPRGQRRPGPPWPKELKEKKIGPPWPKENEKKNYGYIFYFISRVVSLFQKLRPPPF